MTKPTLLLTSCCKEKLDVPAPARELYTGQLFRLIRQYAEKNAFDWRILSAKYGLVKPDQVLEPYDLQIKGRAQIDPLQKTVLPTLAQIWGNYAKVIVIMGAQYLKVLNPILNRQVDWKLDPQVEVQVIHDERGIGGLLQQVKHMLSAGDALARVSCSQCGTIGKLRRLKYAIVCGNCDKVHEHLSGKAPAKTPATRLTAIQRTKKTHMMEADICLSIHSDGKSYWDIDWALCPRGGNFTGGGTFVAPGDAAGVFQELHKNASCNQCQIGTIFNETEGKYMSEPEVKPTEQEQDAPAEQYGWTCAGCTKVIPAGTKNVVQDPHTGKRFHGECYPKGEAAPTPAGEQPVKTKPKKRAKKLPPETPGDDVDGWYAAHMETPEHPYEQWLLLADNAMTPRTAAMRRHLNDPHTDDREELVKRLRDADARRKLYLQRIEDAMELGLDVCPICGEEIDPENALRDAPTGIFVHGSHMGELGDQIAPGALKLPFKAAQKSADGKAAEKNAVPICPLCKLPQTKHKYDDFNRCECKTDVGRARAGMRLYQVFTMYAAQIAPLLSKEEQVEMNVLAEVLSIE